MNVRLIIIIVGLILPLTAVAEPVTLTYQGGAQFTLQTADDQHIMIDVASPAELPFEPTTKDILLTTHRHPDHWDGNFQSTFPGKQLFIEKGVVEAPGLKAIGIPSAHHPRDPVSSNDCTHSIFLIEIGGLRIAHFGDIGQERLTDEQMKQLGEVDVAITQFVNERYSDMTVENAKGFKLMQQLKPKLIIPTSHAGMAALKKAKEFWPCLARDADEILLTEKQLSGETRFLSLGSLASIAEEEFGYQPWPQ